MRFNAKEQYGMTLGSFILVRLHDHGVSRDANAAVCVFVFCDSVVLIADIPLVELIGGVRLLAPRHPHTPS